jgi:hypothetical protein
VPLRARGGDAFVPGVAHGLLLVGYRSGYRTTWHELIVLTTHAHPGSRAFCCFMPCAGGVFRASSFEIALSTVWTWQFGAVTLASAPVCPL